MNKISHSASLVFVLSLTFVITNCSLPVNLSLFSGTAPPGWRIRVSDLIIENNALPEGWYVEFPEDTLIDPTINKVGRSWGSSGEPGTLIQVIWRAFTIQDAEKKFIELQTQFAPTPPTLPGITYVPFERPNEIVFQNQTADEFRLECGWHTVAFCIATARYRNYVAYIHLPLEAESPTPTNYDSSGLTYKEIEKILSAMDIKFKDFFIELDLEEGD